MPSFELKPTSIALFPTAADRSTLIPNSHQQHYLSPPLTPYTFPAYGEKHEPIPPIESPFLPSLPAFREMLPHEDRRQTPPWTPNVTFIRSRRCNIILNMTWPHFLSTIRLRCFTDHITFLIRHGFYHFIRCNHMPRVYLRLLYHHYYVEIKHTLLALVSTAKRHILPAMVTPLLSIKERFSFLPYIPLYFCVPLGPMWMHDSAEHAAHYPIYGLVVLQLIGAVGGGEGSGIGNGAIFLESIGLRFTPILKFGPGHASEKCPLPRRSLQLRRRSWVISQLSLNFSQSFCDPTLFQIHFAALLFSVEPNANPLF